MSESSYQYSITTDFGGSVSTSQLQTKIAGESGITPTIQRIDTIGDNVYIIFDSDLSGGEETTLDTLVSNHTIIKPKETYFSVFPESRQITNSTYNTIGNFNYLGSNKIGTINYITAISKKHKNTTSYDIRIVNQSNGEVIAEKTGLSNDDYQEVDLGTISNIPTSQTICEIQVKHNDSGKKKVYIQELLIYV